MRRSCDACGTPLRGKGHGWPTGNRVLCGRSATKRTVRTKDGKLSLAVVKTPECAR